MFGAIPKDTLAEVLLYLAEKEKFSSLKNLGTISHRQLRVALQDLAEHLKALAIEEAAATEGKSLQKDLKKPFQEILNQLPDQERERLLRGFLN